MVAKQPKLMREQAPKKVLVVGLGKTGLSCARYLSRIGQQVAVTDDRQDPPGLTTLRDDLPDVALFLGRFEPEAFANAEQIVVSPGVSLQHPLISEARARGVEVIGDIELFARVAKAPVVAITGSNGKSTVTTLVGEMARAAGRAVKVGGNLGTPALDLLPANVLEKAAEPDLYVLELSSFQLESTTSLTARAAVILNISPDHMDRYSSLDDYAKAKQRVYHMPRCRSSISTIRYAARLADAARNCVGYSLGAPSAGNYGVREYDGRSWLVCGDEQLMPVTSVRMPGRHNVATHWPRWRWVRRRSAAAAMLTPCAPSAVCRTARNGWPSSMVWFGTTIPRAPMSAQRSRPCRVWTSGGADRRRTRQGRGFQTAARRCAGAAARRGADR